MKNQISKSRLIAKVLSGSWRDHQSQIELSEDDLALINRMLQGSGTGGLSWWRIRETNLRTSQVGEDLHQAYRLQTLSATRHEHDIQSIFRLMRENAVEPVLVKGWAIARLYPAKGLRPYGDIDLFIHPDQRSKALAVLNSEAGKRHFVDIEHDELHQLNRENFEEMLSRAQLVKLNDVDIRVMGLEDHLRLLCLHLLRHGAWRPLWLCDIAVAVETRPANFDWHICLGKNQRHADWILCTMGMAHHFLGVDIEDTPAAERAKRLPKWLIDSVWKSWEAPFAAIQQQEKHKAPMSKYLHHPSGLLQDLRNRWSNPIEATVSVNGAFNNWPRLAFQIANGVMRTAKFIKGSLAK